MAEFSLILYVFGIFLLLTGVGMLFSKIDANPDLSENLLVKFLRKHMRVTDRLHEGHFFVRQADASGKSVVWATPLFLALVLVFIGGRSSWSALSARFRQFSMMSCGASCSWVIVVPCQFLDVTGNVHLAGEII